MPARDRDRDDGVGDPAGGALNKTRKPLRRTAWGMLIGGVVGTALMLAAGAIAVSSSPPAGPDHKATWPEGETMTLSRIPGERNTSDPTTTCTVTPTGREQFTIGEPNDPDFTGAATISCDQPVALMTGASRVVADVTRGPLITLPIFVALLGILFFVPRFTYVWASLGTPRWLRRLFRIPPPR
jgi:hypothetical protein